MIMYKKQKPGISSAGNLKPEGLRWHQTSEMLHISTKVLIQFQQE